MSAVDVLAVMDEAAGLIYSEFHTSKDPEPEKEMEQARAAVAELIEAAKEVTEAPALSADEIKAMARLINALARCGAAK